MLPFVRLLTWYAHDLLARIQFYRMGDKHRGLFSNTNTYETHTHFPPESASNEVALLVDDALYHQNWMVQVIPLSTRFSRSTCRNAAKRDDQMPHKSVIAIDRSAGNPKRKGEDDDSNEIVDRIEELIFKQLDKTPIPPPMRSLGWLRWCFCVVQLISKEGDIVSRR